MTSAIAPDGGHIGRNVGATDALEWLVFINIQCSECGVPEWPK